MFYFQSGSQILDLIGNILIFIAGTAILVKGSDIFIDSAAGIARLWGVSELIIGLTLVSIGTSLPELASSIYASLQSQSDFIIGNIVGSNVTNISLILAIGIIGIGRMPFDRRMLTRDGIFMLAIYLICFVLFAFPLKSATGKTLHGIDFRGGIILLILCVGYLTVLFRQSKQQLPESGEEAKPHSSIIRELLLLVLGIVMITAGSKGMVDPAVWGARQLGISMMVISSTIVAFGTSVPELAVTIAGIVKKRHDIALGNIIGSNIFNILLIFGVTACICPLPLNTQDVGIFNLTAMGITGAALFLFMLKGRNTLNRAHGIILLLLYLVFMIYNCHTAFTGK